MSADKLVRELEHLGVRLWEEAGTLHFRAPKGVMTESRRAALAANKHDVLAQLRAATAPVVPQPAARHEPFPLTDVQSAYFVGRRTSVLYGGVGCHAYGELVLMPVDAERMNAAWQHLVRRHDMLRAVIHPHGGQQVLPEVPEYRIKVADLHGLDGAEVERALQKVRAELDHRVYDPGAWPLFELRLSMTEERSWLHISIDFLIADYVSIFVLLEELRQKYECPDAELPELGLTFRDYLLARRARRTGAAYDRDRAYWLARLEDFPSAPALPMVDPAAAEGAVRFRRRELVLDETAWRSLARQARDRGLTLSAVVLAAYTEVIGCWSRDQRFALGLTILNRPPLHPHVARVVGDFTSVNLLEVDRRTAVAFQEQARRLHRQLGQDLEHIEFSGVELIRELARARGLREALMPIVFTSALGSGAESGGIAWGEFAGGISQTPQVWIDCQAMWRNVELAINWDFREGVFPDGLIDDMFTTFATLIRRLAGGTDAWNDRFPVTIPPEQAARRALINRTDAPLPDRTLISGAISWAARDPERPCVLAEDRTLTYGEVIRHAGAVQAALQRAGCAPGEIVAVSAEKGPLQVIAVLGVLLAGAAYLPIDTDERPARRNEILADAGVRVLVCDAAVEHAPAIRSIDLRTLAAAQNLPHPATISANQLAYVIYTSGSTGKPKGVMITHRSAVNTIHDVNARFAIGPDDRVLCLSGLAFDLSVYDIFGLLTAGGGLVFPRPDRRADPSHWLELITLHRVSVWNSVPAQMHMLQHHLARRPHPNPSTLRLALLSGDRIPVELVERTRTRLPAMDMIALGGATEAAIWSIFFPLRELQLGASFVPYGRPLSNQTVHVVDDALRPVPDGVVGEICIGGEGVALGYLGDETRTAARFVTSPHDAARWYRTGDLGRYLPDGNVEILGRQDAQVKIRGYRIEPGEIEAALERHPAVARATVVVAGEDSTSRRVQAFVETNTCEARCEPQLGACAQLASSALLDAKGAKGCVDYARALDQAAIASIMDTFIAAGLFADGRAHTSAEIVAKLDALPRYHRLVRRWLRAAAAHGALVRDEQSGAYRVAAQGLVLDAADSWRRVDRLSVDYDRPELVDYFRASGRHLAALIRGDRSPLELLYPKGRTDIAASLHEHSFFNRWANRVAAAMAECVADAMYEGRRLRVLELGGGVGGTAASVYPALRHPSDYWFTDISHYFLNVARERFGADSHWTFLRYDMNADYREQGLAPNSFDLIIAGDVLHVARNVPQALSAVRELLAPGGWLISVEMTRDHYQIMTSLELLGPGEDPETGYADDRQTWDQAFYGRDEWMRLLGESQAQPIVAVPRPDDEFSEVGLCVFAARYKADRVRVHPQELAEFLRQRLPDYMLPAQIQILDAMPLAANRKLDRRRLATWEIRGNLRQVRAQTYDTGLMQGLAEIWSLVLGAPAPALDTEFFAAGGDSLLAAQLVGRIIEELPEASGLFFDDLLRRVLEGPTLLELAQAIDRPVQGAAATQVARGEGALVSLGGTADLPACIFIRDSTSILVDPRNMSRYLAERFRLFDVLVGAVDSRSNQELAGRFRALLQDARITDVHLVGAGSGNPVAAELGRQMLESGNGPRTVTITLTEAEAACASELAGQTALFAGDLNLVRLKQRHEADAVWRTTCLGDLRVIELESPDTELIARSILAVAGG